MKQNNSQVISLHPLTQIGELKILKDWEYDRLGKACSPTKGIPPKEFFENKKENHSVYLSNEFLRGIEEVQYVNNDNLIAVKEEDIIFSVDGSVGKVFTKKKGILASTFVLLKIKNEKINKDFLYYFLLLRSPLFDATKVGTSVKHADQFLMKKLPIPIPKDKEQEEIVFILSNIDDWITLNFKLIDEKRKFSLSFLDELIKSKSKIHGYDEDTLGFYFNPVKIPRDWKKISILGVSKKVTDGEHNSPEFVESGIPYISANHVIKSLVFDDCYFVSDSTYSQLIKRCHPEYDDVLLTIKGTVGKCLHIEIKEKFVFDRDICLIKPKKEIIIPQYLEYFLSLHYAQRQIKGFTTKTAVPSIYLNNIRKIELLVPSIPEQEEIMEVMTNNKRQIQKIIQQNNFLESLKKTLMQNLLLGKIRVKV